MQYVEKFKIKEIKTKRENEGKKAKKLDCDWLILRCFFIFLLSLFFLFILKIAVKNFYGFTNEQDSVYIEQGGESCWNLC